MFQQTEESRRKAGKTSDDWCAENFLLYYHVLMLYSDETRCGFMLPVTLRNLQLVLDPPKFAECLPVFEFSLP